VSGVSAVVVHYRGGALLDRCLKSCLAAEGVDEVILVDNEGVGFDLRSRLTDPRIRVIQMGSNAGYGRAANAGLEAAHGDAVLLLNQDAEVPPQSVGRMLEVARASGAWLVGPALVGAGGSLSAAKRRFPAPLDRELPAGNGAGWRYVPWVSGAAMLFAPGHLDLRFDPRLFMYVEDEELCWRVWEAGGRVAHATKVLVRHEGGTATSREWSLRRITALTVSGRTRMVRWHAGRAAAARYVAGTFTRRAFRAR
jgi:GT2 family glycosyltransferase